MHIQFFKYYLFRLAAKPVYNPQMEQHKINCTKDFFHWRNW